MLNFLVETFAMGLRNLHLHKLRSLLTALGIIFGVAAVIVMVAIGEGGKQSALEQIRQLGATNILLRGVRPPESSDASNRTSRILEYGPTQVDLQRIRTLPGVSIVVPLRDTEQRVVRGDVRIEANAIATTPDIFEVINLRLARGQTFSWVQYERAEPVAVIGHKAALQAFPYQDPIGSTLQIGSSSTGSSIVTIIGVLEPTGLRAGADSAGIMLRDLDQDLYFPLTLSQQIFGISIIRRTAGSMERKNIDLSEIWLRAEGIDKVEALASAAENVLAISHPGLTDVAVKAPIQILRSAERTQRLFNFIMVGIASFSLVVGGIGIMNIMLATVTERTKEIGIRRALGAKRKHITLQFLIETTVISLAGGLIGITLGMTLATLIPIVLTWAGQDFRTAITTWSVVGSFVVSGAIGIGFGLYPAIMAARMNPIEALRHE